jgi:hypothetical protein
MKYVSLFLLLAAAPAFAQSKPYISCTPVASSGFSGWTYNQGTSMFGTAKDCEQQANAGSGAQSASSTDGTDPTYTTEPVTQKVPHCRADEKLMQVDPDDRSSTNYIADESQFWLARALEHGNQWITPDTDTVVRVNRVFRCFKDEKPVLRQRDGVSIPCTPVNPCGEFPVSGAYVQNDLVFHGWTSTTTIPALNFQACGDGPGLYPCTVTMPKGTLCGPEGDQVVCHMPEQGK